MNHLINRVGKYKIIEKLRRGWISDVYLATDTRTKQTVALKLIEERDDRDTRDAIKAERDGVKLQQALSLADPTVPRVEDFGTVGSFFFIAMEYVEGEDLSELIERGRLPAAEAIRIGGAVCRTLRVAHTLTTTIDGHEITQIVHGDIKPKNIRLTKDGTVRLLDFGIAKALSLTRKLTHNEFGTLDYCSPERLDTGRLDAQSDLWSLGVMLYEMVSGRLPFQAETPRAQEALIMSGQPPPPLPPDCPRPLRDLIAKALDPDASRRHQSAAEMLEELSALGQPPTRRIHREGEAAAGEGQEAAGEGQEAAGEGREDGGKGREAAPVGGGGRAPAESHAGGAAATVHAEGGGGAVGGARGRRPRVGRLLFKAAVTVVISLCVVLGAAEWLAWKARQELYEDLSKVTFLRLNDSEGYWSRYKGVHDEGLFKLGLPGLSEQMKLKLLNVAQRVFRDYAKDKPTARESDWTDARTSLARVLEIDPGDAYVKAATLYCEGQIERINGDAQKARRKTQDAAARYDNAVRLFGDAAELQPRWPDPHLGLAVVYAYGLLDADGAVAELDKAKELGLNLGEREIALRADCARLKADARYEELRRMPRAQPDDYRRAREQYAQALEKYRLILNFSDNARRYARDIEDKIEKLDDAIEELERPPDDDQAEVKQP